MDRPRRTNTNNRRQNEQEEQIEQELVGGRGGRGGRRGRGRRGGRGGRGGRGNPNPPITAEVITQALTDLMPDLVARIQAAMGNVNEQEEPEDEAVPVQNEPENVNVNGVGVGEVLPRPDYDVRQLGCSFKDFKLCGAPEFKGEGGATGCLEWLESIESIIARSGCAYHQRITYASGMLKGDSLEWWNEEVDEMGIDAANNLLWGEFKELITTKYCPAHELRKLQVEFSKLAMKGGDYESYTRRFGQLSRLIPHYVRPQEVKIEKYVAGLPHEVRVLVSTPSCL